MDVRFDHLMAEALDQHTGMALAFNRLVKNLRLLRRHAFRFTKLLLELEGSYHNELVVYCKTEGRSTDEWTDEHFKIFEQQFGGNRREVFDAVRGGVPESEFVEDGELAIVKHHQRVREKTASVDIDVPSPPEEMTVEEKLAYVTAQLEATRSELRERRREVHMLTSGSRQKDKVIDTLRKDIERAHRRFEKAA